MGEAPPRRKLLRSGARWKPGESAAVRADGLACQRLGRCGWGEWLPGPGVWPGGWHLGRGRPGAKDQGAYAPTRSSRSPALDLDAADACDAAAAREADTKRLHKLPNA
jgi:hypothetical protein